MSVELVFLLVLLLGLCLAAAYLWHRAHRGEPPAPTEETGKRRLETPREVPPVIVIMEAWAGANPSIPIPDYGYPAYSIPMKAFPEWGAAVAAGGRGMSMALIVRRRRRGRR